MSFYGTTCEIVDERRVYFAHRFCPRHEIYRECVNEFCPLFGRPNYFLWIVKRNYDVGWRCLQHNVNDAVEKAYIDPRINYFVLNWDGINHHIVFDNLTAKSYNQTVVVDPFTPQYGTGFCFVRLGYKFIGLSKCEFKWYFLDAKRSNAKHETKNLVGTLFRQILAQSFPGSYEETEEISDFSPWFPYDDYHVSKIEEAYTSPFNEILTSVEIEGVTYEIDFVSMTQKNKSTNKSRQIRRRPAVLDLSCEGSLSEHIPPFSSSAPEFWMCRTGFNEILLNKIQFDYQLIFSHLSSTMVGLKHLEITRIENEECWTYYCYKRASMLGKLGSIKKLNEVLLFHGTSKSAAGRIPRENFDWRLAGNHVGSRFGAGTYFTPDINTALAYASKNDKAQYIFVAMVLMGEYTIGRNGLQRPPENTNSNNCPSSEVSFYDSCVDKLDSPKIVVIFDQKQMYPYYKITLSLN